MEPTTEIPERVQKFIARDLDKQMSKIARFASTDAGSAPSALTAPFNRRNWLALAPDLRLATIRANVTKQVTARHVERHAHKLAKAEAKAKAPAPTPTDEAPTPAEEVTSSPAPGPALSRYLVACIAGCGEFHPASSARPVIVACGDREQTEKKRKHSIYDMETEDLIARFRREAKSGTTSARTAPPQAKRSAKGKAPKKRRRATCSNSR